MCRPSYDSRLTHSVYFMSQSRLSCIVWLVFSFSPLFTIPFRYLLLVTVIVIWLSIFVFRSQSFVITVLVLEYFCSGIRSA